MLPRKGIASPIYIAVNPYLTALLHEMLPRKGIATTW